MPEKTTLIIRPVTVDDAALLLSWRNDPEVRLVSRRVDPITVAEHEAWLGRVINSPDHVIRIAQERAQPVGVVRADREGAAWRLSWTVAPQARGRGIGTRMLKLFVIGLGGRLTAIIKRDNAPSAKVAYAAGLRLTSRTDNPEFDLWSND